MSNNYYWKWIKPPDYGRFAQWSQDVKTLIDSLFLFPEFTKEPIKLCGPDGTGNPILTERWVAFNGDVEIDQAGDAFIIDVDNLKPLKVLLAGDSPDDKEILSVDNWCNTGDKPYGLIVKASLILLTHNFPEEIRVKSDSEEEDWLASRLLCQKIFGVEDVYFALNVLAEWCIIHDDFDEAEADTYNF